MAPPMPACRRERCKICKRLGPRDIHENAPACGHHPNVDYHLPEFEIDLCDDCEQRQTAADLLHVRETDRRFQNRTTQASVFGTNQQPRRSRSPAKSKSPTPGPRSRTPPPAGRPGFGQGAAATRPSQDTLTMRPSQAPGSSPGLASSSFVTPARPTGNRMAAQLLTPHYPAAGQPPQPQINVDARGVTKYFNYGTGNTQVPPVASRPPPTAYSMNQSSASSANRPGQPATYQSREPASSIAARPPVMTAPAVPAFPRGGYRVSPTPIPTASPLPDNWGSKASATYGEEADARILWLWDHIDKTSKQRPPLWRTIREELNYQNEDNIQAHFGRKIKNDKERIRYSIYYLPPTGFCKPHLLDPKYRNQFGGGGNGGGGFGGGTFGSVQTVPSH